MSSGKPSSVFLVALLVASAVLVVVLALQKRSISQRYQDLLVRNRDPHPGLYVPVVNSETITGDSVRLGDPGIGRAQLSFVFGTNCEFSEASLPAWNMIASQLAENTRIDIYGISVDGIDETQAYMAAHDVQFPVVSLTGRRLRALNRTYVVPQTVVVNGDGKVTYAKVGAVTDAAINDSIIASIDSIIRESTWDVNAPPVDSLP